MKHNNISIFVPHVGCPHLCAFCDQRTISGENKAPKPEDVRRICSQTLEEVSDPENTEIAFFGGSFTAIDRKYMISLLEAANEFVGQGRFCGIRLSTRPDYIDDDILALLKEYNVTSIELGAQSLDDTVLFANERGHTADDIISSSKLIRQYGFELGLQLMVGLYKTSEETEYSNMRKVIEISPDTVRIYPVVILKGTKLAEYFLSGEYKTLGFDNVVKICADMLKEFEDNGIRVIKCGLHASEFVERDMVGGFYHPALRELCEAEIYKKLITSSLKEMELIRTKAIVKIAVAPSCISKAVGQKKINCEYFKKLGIELKIVGDSTVPKYKTEIREVSVCT